MAGKYTRVTEKESKPAREYAEKILIQLQNDIKEKYKFQFRLVGSAKHNMMIRDDKGCYDLDYQILLTNNSHMYKVNGLSNATQIKNDFFNWFNRKYSTNQNFKVENSTTSITLRNISGKYSIDFVIIKDDEIIRRNKNASTMECTWNKLPSRHSDVYKFFNDEMSGDAKNDLIENYILPRKVKEKMQNANERKASVAIFIEEVINYAHRIK